MSRLFDLSASDGDLLCTRMVAGQRLEVRQRENLRWMHFGDDRIQAMVMSDRPQHPVLPYTAAMLAGLLFVPQANCLLNLGLGGGAFERFFRHAMPGLSMTSVDNSRAVVEMARQYFFLPPDYPVIFQEADDFLDLADSGYDIILCDIHQGRSQPDCLSRIDFYTRIDAVLRDPGVLVVNLLPESEAWLLQVLFVLRQSFDGVRVLEFPNYRNILLFVTRGTGPHDELLQTRVKGLTKALGVDFQETVSRWRRLPGKSVRKQT